MTTKLTFAIGQEYKANGRSMEPDATARLLDQARHYIAQTYGGFDQFDVVGGYIGRNNAVVIEHSVVFTVYTPEPNSGIDTASWLARLFDQESVLYTVEPIQTMQFVAQRKEIRYVA